MVKTKRFLMLTVVMAIFFTLANLVSGWDFTDPGYDLEYARSDRGVLPQFVAGNTPGTVSGYMVFKQDYGKDGFTLNGETDPVLFTFHPDPLDPSRVLRVWLAYNVDGKTYVYRWETENIAVFNFLVKGGENFFVYSYDGTWDYDGGLISPRVGRDDRNVADISHVTLVFTPPPVETTPEETTMEETTTLQETTSVEETTSAGETTTTIEETTTDETESEETTTTIEETTTAETTLEETTTTVPQDETVTEPEDTTTTESETSELTDASVPLEEPTTTEVETTGTTLEDDDIPQTGESGNNVIIGLVLLGLAASLGLILKRSKQAHKG